MGFVDKFWIFYLYDCETVFDGIPRSPFAFGLRREKCTKRMDILMPWPSNHLVQQKQEIENERNFITMTLKGFLYYIWQKSEMERGIFDTSVDKNADEKIANNKNKMENFRIYLEKKKELEILL